MDREGDTGKLRTNSQTHTHTHTHTPTHTHAHTCVLLTHTCRLMQMYKLTHAHMDIYPKAHSLGTNPNISAYTLNNHIYH